MCVEPLVPPNARKSAGRSSTVVFMTAAQTATASGLALHAVLLEANGPTCDGAESLVCPASGGQPEIRRPKTVAIIGPLPCTPLAARRKMWVISSTQTSPLQRI